MSIPIDTGFDGFPPTWFYLDPRAGTLSEDPAAMVFATSDTVRVSITPRFFNAPPLAKGSTERTQFLKQAKPAAYVRTQLEQIEAGTSTKPLSYGAMYSVIDVPNNDIKTTSFSDPDSDVSIENVPLPGGRGKFRTPITAIVGGTKPKSSLLNILSQVVGLAGAPATKALFPIAGAEIALASNVESLIANVATAFAPETHQQYWINNAAIHVVANQSSASAASGDVLELRSGTTLFAVFQTGEHDRLEADIKAIATQPGFTFNMGKDGELIASKNNVFVNPNPLDSFIYITYQADVTDVADSEKTPTT